MNKEKEIPIIRGICGICQKNVTTHQSRVKKDIKNYYHEKCYMENNHIPILDQICSKCHKPINKEDKKSLCNGRFYHENIACCALDKNMILL